MVITHCDAPVAHAALRIDDGNFRESFLSFLVFERMKPRDCMIELLLRLWDTRCVETDLAQLFCAIVRVRMHLLRSHRSDVKEKRHTQICNAFHPLLSSYLAKPKVPTILRAASSADKCVFSIL